MAQILTLQPFFLPSWMDNIRKANWPQDTPFQRKILGDLLDLRKTADFIKATKIAI